MMSGPLSCQFAYLPVTVGAEMSEDVCRNAPCRPRDGKLPAMAVASYGEEDETMAEAFEPIAWLLCSSGEADCMAHPAVVSTVTTEIAEPSPA